MIIEGQSGLEYQSKAANEQEKGIGAIPEVLETTETAEIEELEPPPGDESVFPPDVEEIKPPAVPLAVVDPEPTTQINVPFMPDPVAPAKKTDKKAKDKAPAKQNRNIMSVAVSSTEFEYLHKVFEARKASGLSNNWNHFLRQCLNYAVNWQKGWQFGVPANIEKVYLDK